MEMTTTSTIDYANYSDFLRYIAVVDLNPYGKSMRSINMHKILDWVLENCEKYEYVLNDPPGTLTLLFHRQEDQIMCILKWI